MKLEGTAMLLLEYAPCVVTGACHELLPEVFPELRPEALEGQSNGLSKASRMELTSRSQNQKQLGIGN